VSPESSTIRLPGRAVPSSAATPAAGDQKRSSYVFEVEYLREVRTVRTLENGVEIKKSDGVQRILI